MDTVPGQSAAVGSTSLAALVNPEGHEWSNCLTQKTVEDWRCAFLKFKEGDPLKAGGHNDGDVVNVSELDPWQKFAHDIVAAKAREREAKEAGVEKLRDYEPLRPFVSGAAGTGKSRTLRCYVKS